MNKLCKLIAGIYDAIIINLISLFVKIKGKYIFVVQLHAYNQLPHVMCVLEELKKQNKYEIFILAPNPEIKKFKLHQKSTNCNCKIFSIYSSRFLIFWNQIIGVDQTMKMPFINLLGGKAVCLFHGQPTKGNTFENFNFKQYDILVSYGPRMTSLIEDYLNKNPSLKKPLILKVGQPKSDALVALQHVHNIKKLAKKKIVYAPSFESHSSLGLFGAEIIKTISSMGLTTIIKPHPAFYRHMRGVGGIFEDMPYWKDWEVYAQKLITEHPNVTFDVHTQVSTEDALLGASVLVTDHSGIAFDAYLLDIPVVYYHCKSFFDNYLRKYHGVYISDFRGGASMNAGSDAGIIVETLDQLNQGIFQYLSNSTLHHTERKSMRHYLLYNEGKATSTLLDELRSMI